MYNKESLVTVTLRELSGHLVELGKYSSAKLNVTNAFKHDPKTGASLEIIDTIKLSKVEKEPVYEFATRNLNLGFIFIEMALNLDEKGKSNRPGKPKKGGERWLRTPEGEIFKNWKNASDEQKIKIHLDKMADDLNCELVTFEILE